MTTDIPDDIRKHALVKNPQPGMEVYVVCNPNIVPLGNVSTTERKYRSRGKAELIELVPKMDDLYWRVRQKTEKPSREPHIAVYRVDELILQSDLTDGFLAPLQPQEVLHLWRLAGRNNDDIVFYLLQLPEKSNCRHNMAGAFIAKLPLQNRREFAERLELQLDGESR